jgi:hypothetical protein
MVTEGQYTVANMHAQDRKSKMVFPMYELRLCQVCICIDHKVTPRFVCVYTKDRLRFVHVCLLLLLYLFATYLHCDCCYIPNGHIVFTTQD